MGTRSGLSCAVLVVLLCGCRLGANDEPSYSLNPGLSDGEPNEPMATGGSSPAAGSGGGGSGGGAPMPSADAGHVAGAGGGASGVGGAAGDPDDADAAVEAGSGGSSGDGCSPVVEVCNPVTNDGCPPTMQCAVDLLATAPTGYCTFSSPPMPGTCFNSGVTESCLPTEACVDFECRKLCFCDADCGAGECCVDPVGEAGFKACGAC